MCLLWVWGGIAPHKTKTLVWQLLHGKATVKGELLKRGIINSAHASCPLCNKSIETVDQLFVGCKSVINLWYDWCNEWGLAWVMLARFKELTIMWNNIKMASNYEKVWKTTMFAITWTVWIGRNEVVFHNKVWDKELIWELIKLRVAMWVKARWQDTASSITDIYRFPAIGANAIKFNVDGAANGGSGEAGIGGLLRNEKGEVLIKFSKAIGRGDLNLAEYLSIREAFILFSSSIWAHNHSFVIESDSRNAIRWINDPSKTPWRLRKWMLHIEVLKKRATDWKIRHTLREGNREADLLAKEGVGREIDLVEFHNPM
ncbi:PREDICTED: uncharacterized protein LOC18599364 [Theobroma cacao]|uniref:Uncharacterized protein LOC18599364 n=1 Tax=Theobroma cacao TaxID=3641 RepID=A0AB32WEP3_THECC|nr:PREDICTED: uncharacterized protein LOC18599364 [Theobroma cacao]